MKWLALDNGDTGVLMTGPDGGEFFAGHYREKDLFRAQHTHELTPIKTTRVHIDRVNRGVGTGACGPDTLAPYRIGGGRHTFTWQIRYFVPGRNDIADLARRVCALPE